MYIYRYICMYYGILSGRLNWKIELEYRKIAFSKTNFLCRPDWTAGRNRKTEFLKTKIDAHLENSF